MEDIPLSNFLRAVDEAKNSSDNMMKYMNLAKLDSPNKDVKCA